MSRILPFFPRPFLPRTVLSHMIVHTYSAFIIRATFVSKKTPKRRDVAFDSLVNVDTKEIILKQLIVFFRTSDNFFPMPVVRGIIVIDSKKIIITKKRRINPRYIVGKYLFTIIVSYSVFCPFLRAINSQQQPVVLVVDRKLPPALAGWGVDHRAAATRCRSS